MHKLYIISCQFRKKYFIQHLLYIFNSQLSTRLLFVYATAPATKKETLANPP